jgi:hypothetical protein
MYARVWGCMHVCGSVYIYMHTWTKGNWERERKPVTRKEIKSAKIRAPKTRSAKN